MPDWGIIRIMMSGAWETLYFVQRAVLNKKFPKHLTSRVVKGAGR